MFCPKVFLKLIWNYGEVIKVVYDTSEFGVVQHMCLRQILRKLEPCSRVCLLVGHPKETRGGLFFHPKLKKVFVSKNATFFEEDNTSEHKPCSKIVLNELSNENTKTQ